MAIFRDIFDDVTKYATKVPTNQYLEKGKHIIIDQGQKVIAGYTNDDEGIYADVPAIIFGDHTRIIKYVDKPFFLGADGVKVLKAKDQNTNYKYLFYALSNVKIPDTGYNRHFKWLKESEVCYPDYERQKEIVGVLDKVTDIIDKRKKQLEKLDELIKSRFIEMFGDIGGNEKGWGINKLSYCCEVNPKKTNDTRLQEKLKVSFIPMPAVSEHGDIDSSETKLYEEVKSGFTYFCENDVLFAKITPCMENGKGAIAKGLCNGIGFGSTEFHVLRPFFYICNSQWLYTLTTFERFRKDAETNMTGSAGQKRVPASFLENFKVSVPPIELQNQFAAFVEQTDKSKSAVQNGLEKLELLKNALMQKYFG